MNPQALLRIVNLQVQYRRALEAIPGVGPIDLEIGRGEMFGIVGESGGGKSTLSMAILGNLPQSAVIEHGQIIFEDKELVSSGESARRAVRWKKLAYVPQGAMNALNPVRRIGAQFADIVRDHEGERLGGEWLRKTAALLQAVRLTRGVLDKFPHELSGGMRQRVCIAMALLFGPKLIIADEPTSALDVISQRDVLQTLQRVRDEFGTSIILIGHDLAVQAQVADRIGIMRAGQFVEIGALATIFHHPAHPYTRTLIASALSIRSRTGIPPLQATLAAPEKEPSSVPLREVQPGHYARVAHHSGQACGG